MITNQTQRKPPFVAKLIYRLSPAIILGWLAIAVILSTAVPSLEQVEREHAIALTPDDAPSFKATQRMGELFKESDSDSVIMIVLEGDQPLGDSAHAYYNDIIRQLKADTQHVEHIQDFWGDPLTANAAQSGDGKAAYVQVNLKGNLGQASSNESVDAVRKIMDQTPPPAGVRSYVTGPAAFVADLGSSGNRTVIVVTVLSIAVIFTMLLLVYRSIITVLVSLVMVFVQLQVTRGFVAFLGDQEIVTLTTYVINLLVSLVIAAGTDYGIFFFGRYHEARLAGEDKLTAFYTTYRSVAKVVLASGLTIAGAVFCLSFARLPYFQPLGIPGAAGILVAVAVALTLVPAVVVAGARIGLFEPKQKVIARRWRRVGTAVVRWPAPILLATMALALIGLLALPGYRPSYNDQDTIPKEIPSYQGYEAAKRHFPPALMMAPDILLIEADHDMRNSADFLVLNKLAKSVLAVPGIARVQAPTRPAGEPLEHTTIPFIISMGQASQLQNLPFQKDRMEDMLKQADEMTQTIALMNRMMGLMKELYATTHAMTQTTHELEDITGELRDHIADFDDFFRPIRNYLYWEPHCFNIPLCWSIRSIFDVIDGVDRITVKMRDLVNNLDQLDLIMPQLLAQFPPMIATMESTRTIMLTMHSTMSGMLGQMDEGGENSTAMGKAFDAAKNDDSFYLPPDAFKNKDFKKVLDVFMSEDGKAARMLISHRDDPLTPEGIARVEPIKTAAEEALKGTPLENAKISLGGSAAMAKDLVEGSTYDLLIAGVSALCLIFTIMLIMTRSFVAALVIVGTVAVSLGTSFGLSVLIWQHILGIQIHWVVLAMSVIVLLAVGSDYNLLLVARMKEELGAGINTGIIRAMAGTGKVVTAAGLVFAATMFAMLASDLRTLGQVGSTIGLGLVFDTLIVRAFMTPSIAALLGRWFWWPQRVHPRPHKFGNRPLVRSLFTNGEH
ncbi:RND family transporter [Mycobacterium sp. E740]|uniref:MMPL/RND family transporter n=1 Tax=Mycobacterium sp. E740 TaxID=1834149 RepID=UPI0008017941|nr:RND family transporter [Mycobacterium sp. E740]OBI85033.1 hypothetical protein A5663_01005 [Mycobacterium sp. E740]